MNKFCYPGTEKSDKTGFQKHHQLVKSTKNQNAIESEKKVRESLPTDWMYNDSKAKEVWDELEYFSTREEKPMITDQPNPFSKIDDSAAKIRNTINDFEAHDQEFLLELMDLVGDDSYADSISGDSLLFEARCRLQQMIEEHIDFGERQANLLQNLTSWFVDAKDREESELSTIHSLKDTSISQDKIDELKDLIQTYISNTSSNLEKAEIIHQDLVQNLNEKVQECQKTISQKDMQITQINQTFSQKNQRKRSPNNFISVRNSVHYDSTLAHSQKKVMELETQLHSLKSTLNTQTKIEEPTSIGQTEIEDDDDEGGIISVQKEIEFESKLAILTAQIKNLKMDNKSLQEQILQVRQNEIVTEKKLNSMERQKKTLESSLLTANKKLETVKQQLNEKKNEEKTDEFVTESRDNEIELRKMYESKIDQMNEDYRKQINLIHEQMDKKYKNQLKELMATCKSDGSAVKALEQITANYQQQMLEYEKKNQNDIKDEKRRTAEKLQNLAKHYETLISRKEQEMIKLRKNNDTDTQNKIEEFKLDYDDKINSQKLEEHEKLINELSEIKMKMELNFNQLKDKFNLVKRERDSLKELMDIDTLNELNLMEEEDFNDEIFQNSMFELKQKEIEEKLGEKYGLELKHQKEVLQTNNMWEIEHARNFFTNKYQELINHFRKSVLDNLNNVSEKIKSEDLDMTDFVNLFLTNTLKTIEVNTDPNIIESFKNPTVPLYDVDKKIMELNNQIITLKSENDLWKKTYERSDSDPSQKNKLETMKKIVEEQSKKMAEIQKQSKLLQEKLNRLHTPQLEQLDSMDQPKLIINDPFIFEIEEIDDYFQERPVTIEKSKPINENEEIYNNDESIEIAFHNDDDVCSKCKRRLHDYDFSDEVIEYKIAKCGNCHHTSVFVQTDDLIKNKIIKEIEHSLNIESQNSFTLDNISLPTISQNFDDNSSQPQYNEKSTETSARLNLPQNFTEQSTETSARLITPEETKSQSNENEKPSTQLNSSTLEIKSQLEEEIENNQKLKRKLDQYQKHFKDLERQYLSRIENMKAEMIKYQTQYLNNSIEMVETARNLENEGENNLKQKVKVSHKVAKTIEDIDFPKRSLTRSLSEQFIDYTQKNLNDVCSFEAANNALDQAKTVLTHIKEDTNEFISEKTFKKTMDLFTSIRNEQEQLKNFMTHFITNFRSIIRNVHSKFKVYNTPEQVLIEKVYQLEQTLTERTNLLNSANQKLLSHQENYDHMQEKFRETISQLEQLQIHSRNKSDEADILKKDELKCKDIISNLTNQVMSNQDDIRQKEKEIEQLKLSLIHLETENMMFSQSLFNVNNSFDLIEPFVIFSTSFVANNEFQLEQSEPIFVDQISPQNIVDQNILEKGVEGKKLTTPNVIEKVKIKYIQSNYPNQLSKSPCKVIIPQPKSQKLTKTIPISSNELSKPSDSETIHKDLSFDDLVPVLEQSGSLIGYVTHYIPKPNETDKQQKPKLEQSGVLISEVPLDKLRFEPSISLENISQQDSQSNFKLDLGNIPDTCSVKSNLSLAHIRETSSKKSALSSQRIPESVSMRSQFDLDVTKSEWINKFNKRVRWLENKLRESVNRLKDEQDKSHRAFQAAFKASTELRQSLRTNKKLTLLHEATKHRLAQALSLINKNDKEISRLKKLLIEYSQIARNKEIEFNKIQIEKKDENENLLTAFRGIDNNLTKMVEEEIRSIRRWTPKRDAYIEDEKNRLLLALQAMRFATNDNEITMKSSFQVKSLEKRKKKPLLPLKPVPKTPSKPEPMPSYEKAMTNMNGQSFSKSLNKGVVGRPITYHSSKRGVIPSNPSITSESKNE